MSSELVSVRLIDFPVEIWQQASAHQEAVQREFDIIRSGLPEDAAPNRFQQLVTGVDARFGWAGEPTWKQLHEAAERGDTSIDLTFRVPVEVADAARQLDSILAEVDEFCRAGDRLLTLATPDELVRFRQWFLTEFIRQIEGRLDPKPWDKAAESGEETTPPPNPLEPTGASNTIRFAGDLDIATAGALRDEIVESRAQGVSQLTVDLAGIDFMDSVGISLLVSAHNRAIDDGIEMTLILPARLKPLIEMTGLTDVLRPRYQDHGEH